jgi:hypothetical protein
MKERETFPRPDTAKRLKAFLPRHLQRNQPGSSLTGPINNFKQIKIYPPLDRSTSLLNIVIHMLFASTDHSRLQRDQTLILSCTCQQENISQEKYFSSLLLVVFDVHPSLGICLKESPPPTTEYHAAALYRRNGSSIIANDKIALERCARLRILQNINILSIRNSTCQERTLKCSTLLYILHINMLLSWLVKRLVNGSGAQRLQRIAPRIPARFYLVLV